MKAYAKLISETEIELAPRIKGSIINYNLSEELMKSDGYKPLIKVENIDENRLYKKFYTEDEENISEVIVYNETQEEFFKRKNNEIIQSQINTIISQLNEYDFKRIRAMAEPSIKDETTGETWLDFYTKEIQKMRSEIAKLNEDLQNDITN